MSNVQARRERRYKLVNPELVQATILPVEPGSVPPASAELRELSQSTAKLLVSGPPELRYWCRLSLQSHRLPRSFNLPIEIHWARPNPHGDWLLGCQFVEPINDQEFRQWMDSGVLNRRSSQRERTRIPVAMQVPPAKNRVPAIVSDFSEGGLCLTTSDVPHGSRHLCVYGRLADAEVRIPLKVRWSLSVGPNRFVGCQFLRPSDYQSLRKLHLEIEAQPSRGQARELGRVLSAINRGDGACTAQIDTSVACRQ